MHSKEKNKEINTICNRIVLAISDYDITNEDYEAILIKLVVSGAISKQLDYERFMTLLEAYYDKYKDIK